MTNTTMKSSNLIIKKPWISEKSTDLASLDKYVFLVIPEATSHQIKQAIQSIYKVHVVKVNITNMNQANKKRKKAIVTLKAGEKIDVVPH